MSLIKSISGIRGTIGGKAGENLTPQDVVECTAAFAYWLKQQGAEPRIVLGRDARISGAMVAGLVSNTLIGLGFEVIDLGLSTTPTVEMAVTDFNAGAGIILTASHNPKNWNALKLLNHKGEFISKKDGESLLALLKQGDITYVGVEELGKVEQVDDYMNQHIAHILKNEFVDAKAIKEKEFKVVVDCINSTGSISIPPLLEALGCTYTLINGEPTGDFAHNPEPLPKNLIQLSEAVKEHGADIGIAVDPDVDRLALVCEDGSVFGEEYTLVAVADYMLGLKKGGNTVSNLSSSRALRDITERHGGTYYASAVGEVNVVEKMKAVNALIGGEGNGGIIVPDLHYGRDALAGIALLLSYLSRKEISLSELRKSYPDYKMIKDKISLTPEINLEELLTKVHEHYKSEDCNTIDGLKIDFENAWVHLRKSNTEPIIRVYAEALTTEKAEGLVNDMKAVIDKLLNPLSKV